MPDGPHGITIRMIEGIDQVAAAEWDACAGTGNPFVSHAFLSALELSGSAEAACGWAPRHLLAQDDQGALLACAPLYLKSHSFGEYVFDWAWADAWERSGRDYYPKLQCAIPFSPVTGPRLLVHPELHGQGLDLALADAMVQLATSANLSSVHVTFSTEAEARAMEKQGWLLRMGEQYHWTNAGYRSFDDFLAALSSRKRKNIRKERQHAQDLGLDIVSLTGDAITERHWDALHRFYLTTVMKKNAHAYLTRDFFHRLGAGMADRVLLVMAERDGRPVAGALNLIGTDTLYGRNWGAEAEFQDLHFELCYYRAIDFAIARGLTRVEAGAQGEHKISRGYLPVPTWSAHWIREAPLRRAVATMLDHERELVAERIRETAEAGPYRQD